MTTVPQLATAMQTLLTTTAEALAQRHQLIRRRRCLSGATLAQTLVFAWADDPDATEDHLARVAALVGCPVSPRALTKRFVPATAAFLHDLLAAAVAIRVRADPVAMPVLRRFTEVVVLDSTTVTLPDQLAPVWRGCGGSTAHGTAAAVKLTVGLDLKSGHLHGPVPHDGKSGDLSAPLAAEGPKPGGLRIADLGYFSLKHFAAWGEAGGYWLSRLKTNAVVLDDAGRRIDLPRLLTSAGADLVDIKVRLGVDDLLACRLIARRVPPEVAARRRERLIHKSERRGDRPSVLALTLCDWAIVVTNIPERLLSGAEALVLYRLRWQIELVFKRWKSHGGLQVRRGANPWRALCEMYAKLVAMVIQHWLVVAGSWSCEERSLSKAARVVSSFARLLAVTLPSRLRLAATIRAVLASLARNCWINQRKKNPNACHLFTCQPGAT